MSQQVTVIIPVHGSLDPVHELLTDLIGPRVPAEERPARILVIDDASPQPLDTDALPEGVELVAREVNGGFGAAVNTGLRAARTELALVLNSDLRLPTGFVRDLLAHARSWQPAVVGCRLEDESGHSGYSARTFPTVAQQVIEWLVPLASLRHTDLLHRAVGHDLDAERGHGMVPVDWVSGAVMLLPVPETLAIGGFDEGYFMYTEEVDLQLRLRRQGMPALLDADLVAIHAGGASSGGEERRRRWLVGARMRFARKHLNESALRTGLLAASGVNLVWNTGRRAAGRDVEPWATWREQSGLALHAGKELPR